MKKKILVMSIILGLVSNAWAQNTDTTKTYTLEEVKVHAKSILNKTSTDANKMSVGYLETPQVYNSVSRVVLEKQIATTIEDAMHNIPGVSKLWDATGRPDGGSLFTSRGFYSSARARNGLANIATTNLDMANIERLEVIKGPSATLFGSIISSYGGVINRITKQPYFKNGGNVNFAFGEQGFYRGSADVNVVLNKQKTLAARLNLAGQNQDSWQDQGFSKTYLIAPTVTYRPNERLEVNLEGEFLGSKSNSGGGSHVFILTPSTINGALSQALPALGLPTATVNALLAMAPKTFKDAYGTNRIDELKLDYNRSYLNNDIAFTAKTSSLFGNVSYKINENWKSQTSITYSRINNDGYMGYQYLMPNYLPSLVQSLATGVPNFGTSGHSYLARMVWSPQGYVSNFEAQQNFISDYKFGNQMRNRAVIGLDYSNFVSRIDYKRFTGSLLGLPYPDVFDVVPAFGEVPNYSNFNLANVEKIYQTNPPAVWQNIFTNNIYSAYINDIFNVNDYIVLNAGLRIDHFDQGDRPDATTNYNQTKLAPKFGFIVSPIKDKIGIFGNYQNGFTNKNGVDANGNSFIPEEANQWEAGVKYNLWNDKVTGSISYYDILVKNIVRADVNNPMINIQDGEQHSKGIEVEVLANPARGWTIMAGYGYNDSKFVKAAADVQGRRPQGSGPENTANFWTNYTFTSTFLKGFGLGFSANYSGEAVSISSNIDGDLIIPSYTLLGTHFTYDTKHFKVGVKVNNVTNEKYWMGWTNLIPQRPRQAMLTLGYKF